MAWQIRWSMLRKIPDSCRSATWKKTVVVDHIDHGIAIAKKYRQSLRLVTLEGDLINPGGSMTGGAFKNSSNLLSRRREIEEFEKHVVVIKTRFRKSKNRWLE